MKEGIETLMTDEVIENNATGMSREAVMVTIGVIIVIGTTERTTGTILIRTDMEGRDL